MRNLLILLLLTGCYKPKPIIEMTYPRVNKSLCVHQCVRGLLYNIEEVGGSAVADMQSVCVSKFAVVDCCKDAYNYSECKDE